MKDQRTYAHADYDRLVEQTVDMIKKLSHEKGGEYAGDVDRLANFRRNGEDIGLSMEQVWRVYAGKHWDAITQYVHDLGTGKERPRMESLAGRADDMIVYLILFKAMLEERHRPDARLVYPPTPPRRDRGLFGLPPTPVAPPVQIVNGPAVATELARRS